MTRIAADSEGSYNDRRAIIGCFGKIQQCNLCEKESTIWVRTEGYTIDSKAELVDLFLCDICAFHLARIIVRDIGHSFEGKLST